MMKARTCLTLLLLVGSTAMHAQDALTSSFNEMDVRRTSMAGSGVASERNVAFSAFSNASIIPFYEGTVDAAAGYVGHQAASIGTGAAGVAWRISDRIGLSLSGGFDRGPGYDILDETGEPAGVFMPSAARVGLGAGFRILDNLSAGVAARFVSETLAEGASYHGFAGDITLSFRPMDNLTVSTGARNFGTSIKDQAGNAYGQPIAAFLGADWVPVTGEHTLRTDLDATVEFSGSTAFVAALGLEYGWKDMLFARAGYHYATGNALRPGHGFGAGLGVRFSGARLDAGFFSDAALGWGMAFGIGLNL